MFRKLLLIATLLLTHTAHAATIERPLADAAQERRAQAIFHALKCVVCEGQSLSDSDATLAREMRAHVREQLAQGSTEAEILAFFRTRYGDAILMTPPIGPTTYALWLAPLILLLIGGGIVWRSTRPPDKDPA